MGRFVRELRRRKVVQVAAVYAIVAWLLVQIVVAIEAPLNLPIWVDTLVIVLVAVGFPIAIVLAWAFEVTPEGVRRAGGGAGTDPVLTTEPAAEPELDPKTIAVLPFENLSPDLDNAWFAAGLHEEVLHQLARIHDLNVIARTSVLQYEAARKPVPEIARELHVGTVMEGSVRYAGDRVRVTAQLIDSASNTHVWSENFDRNLDDIFAIQSDIALGIANALRATLTAAETNAITRPPTNNPEAYRAYLAGVAEWIRPAAADYEKALERFDRAIELDPVFASAYALKAVVLISTLENFNVALADDPHGEALQAVEKALALDPLLGAAHAARGYIIGQDWDEALAAFQRGAELAPNEPGVLGALAFHLACMGRAEEAIPVIQHALTLDPLSANTHRMAAIVYGAAGQVEEAIHAGETSIVFHPLDAVNHIAYAMMFSHGRRHTDAMRHLGIAETMEGASDPQMQMLLAEGYASVGELDRAREIAEHIDLDAQDAARHAGYLVGIGNPDGAIDVLTREFAEVGHLPRQLNIFPSLMPLHADPRYKALMKKTGLEM